MTENIREAWVQRAETSHSVFIREVAGYYLDKGYDSPRNADLLNSWDVFHQIAKHKMSPVEAVQLVKFCFGHYHFGDHCESVKIWLDKATTAPAFIRDTLRSQLQVEDDPYDSEYIHLEMDWKIFELVVGSVGRPTPEQVAELIRFCFDEVDPSTRKDENQ